LIPMLIGPVHVGQTLLEPDSERTWPGPPFESQNIWTLRALRPPDFESGASASSPLVENENRQEC